MIKARWATFDLTTFFILSQPGPNHNPNLDHNLNPNNGTPPDPKSGTKATGGSGQFTSRYFTSRPIVLRQVTATGELMLRLWTMVRVSVSARD